VVCQDSVIQDRNSQALAYVYFEDEPVRWPSREYGVRGGGTPAIDQGKACLVESGIET
jgi:hypothetical protein